MTLTLSVTLVSVIGGLSAVLIFQDFDKNINIDTENSKFTLDINATSGEINNIEFTLPFNITNAGYFDLENLKLTLQIAINYSQVDYPSPGLNETRTVIILDKPESFGNIPKRSNRDFIYSVEYSDFIIENFPDLATEVDLYSGPPILSFFANLTISLDYSIGLHSLRFGVRSMPVGEYQGGV
ncbi:MAG: hypothetical protein ACFFB0_05055 [Promethearchaeota archaeon]